MKKKSIKVLIFLMIIWVACCIDKLGFTNQAYAVNVQDATGSAASMPNPANSTIYSCQGEFKNKTFSNWAQVENYFVGLGYQLNTSATPNGDWSETKWGTHHSTAYWLYLLKNGKNYYALVQGTGPYTVGTNCWTPLPEIAVGSSVPQVLGTDGMAWVYNKGDGVIACGEWINVQINAPDYSKWGYFYINNSGYMLMGWNKDVDNNWYYFKIDVANNSHGKNVTVSEKTLLYNTIFEDRNITPGVHTEGLYQLKGLNVITNIYINNSYADGSTNFTTVTPFINKTIYADSNIVNTYNSKAGYHSTSSPSSMSFNVLLKNDDFSQINVPTFDYYYASNTYTVAYNGNGATGGSTASSSHIYDTSKNLTANGFVKNHSITYNHNYSGSTNAIKSVAYTFKNWNTAANGTGTAYNNSASVKNLTTTNGGTVNLYAQWTSNSATYVPSARTGYVFEGWYSEPECINKVFDNNYTPTSDMTVYAKWIPITYTVAYNGNGATGGSTTSTTHTYDTSKNLTANGYERKYTVTYNHNYSGSENTSKIATYSFKNWNTVANGSGTTYSNSQSVKNLTTTNGGTVNLYAQWTSSSVTYVPIRAGYIFQGWYKEGSCITKITDGTYMPTANITVYAKWTPITYTVIYNGNGATGGSTSNSIHTYDVSKTLTPNGYEKQYTVIYNHNYSGSANISKIVTYSFKNWNTAANGSGTTYNNIESVKNLTTTNGVNVNLYAQWESHSITYIPVRTGYTFGGWYVEEECVNKVAENNGIYTPTANITLYAKWTPITYTVKYNGNGATNGSTVSSIHTYDTVKALMANGYERKYTVRYNHNYKDSEIVNKTATYTFKNWNLEGNGTGTTYGNKESVINLTATNGDIINMYAQWSSSSIAYVPTRTGYIFDGWYLEARCINKVSDGTYTPMSNITLYANWRPITYTVKYDGNGATGGNTESSTHIYDKVKALTPNGFERKYQVTYNHNYSESTNINKTATYTFKCWTDKVNEKRYGNKESVCNLSEISRGIVNLYAEWNSGSITYIPEREGYIFEGWYLEAGCINKVSDGTYTPMTDRMLFAKWRPITYTVKYDGNGATGGNTESSIHTYDIGQNLRKNEFERIYNVTYNHNYKESTDVIKTSTYTLENWNTKVDGTGTMYAECESVNNLTSRNGSTVNLYAKWRSNSIRYIPQRAGYVFEGWYKESDCINKVSDGVYTPTEDITLYAKWEIYSYRYIVNYLEKDETPEDNTDNKVLCEPKVSGSNLYGEKVSSVKEIIDIDGYYYDSSEDIQITEIEDNNVINIYYNKRSDLSYKVNYLDKDNNKVLYNQKITENQIFEDVINSIDEVIQIDGYNFESSDKERLEIGTRDNVINLYYTKRNDLSYIVNYLEKDTNKVLHKSKLVEGQSFKDIINCTNEVIQIDGYNFDIPEKNKIEIGIEENIINLYYTKREDLSYKVNYLEKDSNNVLSEPKVIENQRFEEIINSIDEVIQIDGYNFESSEKEAIKIGTENNVINLYYTKKEDLTYEVNYLEKDTKEVLHELKVVENQRFKDTINSINEVIEIDGYDFESSENETIQISTGENVINLYYTKRTNLSYIVNYLEKDSNKVLCASKVVENQKFKDTITALNEVIEIEGYDFESSENETIQISTRENVINLYYTKQTNLSYTVNYLERYSNKVLHESKIVQNLRFGDIINSINEVIEIEGYDFNSIENEILQIGIGENIINLYYSKKTDLTYKVEYYYNGKLDESKTETIEATYQDKITEYDDKVIAGYKLEKTENLPLIVQEYEGLNIIKIYYIKDEFNYTVNYYYDGEKDESATSTYTATYKDIINTYEDKIKDGYRLDRVENMPLEVSELAEENVINVYYVRKDSTVRVKYVDKYNGEEILEATIKDGKVFDEFDVSSDVKEVEGYTLVESPEKMTGTFEEEPREKVYYYAKNSKVIVKYLEKDEEGKSLAEETIIEGYEGKEYRLEQKEIENYTFVESTNNTEGTMAREEITVIYYYLQKTKVTVNYIDKNTEEKLEVITKEGLVGDTYIAVAKDFEDYVLVERPEKETVEMTKEEIVLNYYYVHISSGVIEKHIDINTNEVLETQVYEGNEGDEYTTKSKEFEGYDLVEDKLPENAEGTMLIEAIEVKYYYERKVNVRVEYIDKITNEKLTEDEYIYGHENNEYSAEEKEFKDYVVVKEMYPENVTGTMQVRVMEDGTVNTETVVKYYYVHISEGVIERHLNVINGELLEEVRYHEGNEGDEYKIEAKTFEGYDLVEDRLPENAKGKMTKEKTVVSYYYVRRTELEVEYIDKYSGERLQEKEKVETDGDIYTEKDSTEIVKGHEGDRYETKEKVFEKYKLVETSNNTEGTMKVTVEEDGTVNTRTVR